MSRSLNLNRLEYEKRVNRVIDHIDARLSMALTLTELAGVAAFSPFHFHRIFKSFTGETLYEFIQRLRLEKAARVLAGNRGENILGVALDHGFASAATFARAFRAHFGMTASQWRDGGFLRHHASRRMDRNLGKPIRKDGKARSRARGQGASSITGGRAVDVQVKNLPAYRVAYMRYVGPYGAHGLPQHWAKFHNWVTTHGLEACMRLGVAYDDPNITAQDKCRYDACVVVPDDFRADKWVNVTTLPAGRCAVTSFTGTAHEIADAWEATFTTWLPNSGFQPDNRPCFEIYRADQGNDPARFSCELCLPIKPL